MSPYRGHFRYMGNGTIRAKAIKAIERSELAASAVPGAPFFASAENIYAGDSPKTKR